MAALRVVVIHWNADELAAKVRLVEKAGGEVVASEASDARRASRQIEDLAPDAVVLWSSRQPSHSRLLAASLRSQPWGRKLPVLFVDADPDPLPAAAAAQMRSAVPDALWVTPTNLSFWLGKVASLRSAQKQG